MGSMAQRVSCPPKGMGGRMLRPAPEVLRKTLVSLVNTDLRDIIANIKSSTLLIWGDRDTDTPLSDAKIIESLIPDSGLCVYENAGHFAFFEQQGKTIAILNSFLGKEN